MGGSDILESGFSRDERYLDPTGSMVRRSRAVLTAADWMAAMDEPSALRARPEATFENRHRPSRHGADASSVGHDGGVRFSGTAEAKTEFGATNIGFGRPLRAFTRVSAEHAE